MGGRADAPTPSILRVRRPERATPGRCRAGGVARRAYRGMSRQTLREAAMSGAPDVDRAAHPVAEPEDELDGDIFAALDAAETDAAETDAAETDAARERERDPLLLPHTELWAAYALPYDLQLH